MSEKFEQVHPDYYLAVENGLRYLLWAGATIIEEQNRVVKHEEIIRAGIANLISTILEINYDFTRVDENLRTLGRTLVAFALVCVSVLETFPPELQHHPRTYSQIVQRSFEYANMLHTIAEGEIHVLASSSTSV